MKQASRFLHPTCVLFGNIQRPLESPGLNRYPLQKWNPIGFYGDSARVDMQNYTSVHVLSFFCDIILWKPKSVRWSRFLVMSIEEERLTSGTIPAILRRRVTLASHCLGRPSGWQGSRFVQMVYASSVWNFGGIGLTKRNSGDLRIEHIGVEKTFVICAMQKGSVNPGRMCTGMWKVHLILTSPSSSF